MVKVKILGQILQSQKRKNCKKNFESRTREAVNLSAISLWCIVSKYKIFIPDSVLLDI